MSENSQNAPRQPPRPKRSAKSLAASHAMYPIIPGQVLVVAYIPLLPEPVCSPSASAFLDAALLAQRGGGCGDGCGGNCDDGCGGDVRTTRRDVRQKLSEADQPTPALSSSSASLGRGGKGCEHPDGCNMSAVGTTPFCKKHGGGRKRCTHPDGCIRSAVGKTPFCINHGGGNRCTHPGCLKGAAGKTSFCKKHGPK